MGLNGFTLNNSQVIAIEFRDASAAA